MFGFIIELSKMPSNSKLFLEIEQTEIMYDAVLKLISKNMLRFKGYFQMLEYRHICIVRRLYSPQAESCIESHFC